MPNYGSYEKFPYTNFHGLNLDWLLQKMQELEQKVDTEVIEEIRRVVSSLIIEDIYDADTETLTITLLLPEEE